jgi:hypothetical protein
MQVFVNISSGGCFNSENYAQQPTQGTSALRAPFLHRSQLLPGTRGNISHPFTLCRGVSIQKRSKPCCTTGQSFPSTLPWCGAQSLIQAIHRPSSHNACPPSSEQAGRAPDIHLSKDELPRRLLQALRGPTHVHVFLQDIRRTVAKCPLTCKQKKIQMTFPSHSKSLGQHGFYGARRTAALVINS